MSVVYKSGQTELVSQSVIDEPSRVARRYQVMISITITPYDDAEPDTT